MQQRRVRRDASVYGSRSGRPVRRSPWRPDLGRVWQIILLLVVVVVLSLVWRAFRLQHIQVEGGRIVSADSVVQLTQDSLKNPFGRNLLTLDGDQLSQNLLEREYRLKSVEVVRKWPHTVVIRLEEREPALKWKTDNEVYVLDVDGTVAGRESDFSTKLPVVVDSTNLPVKIGARVVPARFTAFTRELDQALARRTSLEVSEYRVPDTTSEIYAKTGKGYVVKFDTTRGVDEQVTDLANVLEQLNSQAKTPVEYIDLRIPNKAYWR